MRNLAKRVCAADNSIVRAHVSSFQNPLNVVVAERQSREEYLGGSRIRLGGHGTALNVGEADSIEKSRGSTLPPQNDGEVVEVPLPSGAS